MNDFVDILEHRVCEIHDCNLVGSECDDCDGEGGYHDCGEDSCCCLDPDEPNETCGRCHGTGHVEWCPEWSEQRPCTKKEWKTVKTWEDLKEEEWLSQETAKQTK